MAAKPRAVMLTVAEVEDMRASIQSAQTVQDLTGRQREELMEGIGDLTLRSPAPKGAWCSCRSRPS